MLARCATLFSGVAVVWAWFTLIDSGPTLWLVVGVFVLEALFYLSIAFLPQNQRAAVKTEPQ